MALHKLEGTYDASRHRRRRVEPNAEGELAEVKPPLWMSASQKRVWREIIKDAPKGILRRADRRTFINYVVAAECFETATRAQNKLDEAGAAPLLGRGSAGPMISPYVKIQDRTMLIMTQLGAELGFTPTSRARLGQPEAPREPAAYSAWAELRRFPSVIQGGKA